MKTFSKFCIALLILLVAFPVFGEVTVGGRTLIRMEYDTTGEKHWFATSSGNGDCTSWNNACTFRTAVTKCKSSIHDTIYLGEGSHDTDNGVDGNGTEITVDGITIIGVGSPWAANARLVNSHATAATVLKVTGDGFNIRTVDFDNTGQTDEDVIFLHVNGSDQGNISDCRFRQSATATTGIGILLDGDTKDYHFGELIFQDVETVSFQTNGATCIHATHLHFQKGGIGISLAGASDSAMCFKDFDILKMTTAISITGASVDDVSFSNGELIHNTTNIVPGGVYDGVHFQDIKIAHKSVAIYPVELGVAVSTGDGVWIWTAAPTTIIPADTIAKPFIISDINVQDTNADMTFKLEVFYGESTANISIGIWEFTAGKNAAMNVNLDGSLVPANSIVGVKAMSSDSGVDTVTITISYIAY